MISPLVTIFNMVINFAMLLIFIRFMLQFSGLERSNPYIEPAFKATQVVDVFGRIFPTINDRISVASLVLLFLLQLINITGNVSLGSNVEANSAFGSHLEFQLNSLTPLYLLCYALFTSIIGFLKASFYIIVASIIVSWIVVFTQKMHPILGIVMQLSEPLLAPFRRIAPDLGVIDISPIIAFLVIILSEMGTIAIASIALDMFS